MCTYNLCIEQKYENSQKLSAKNCQFFSLKNSMSIAWACYCNALFFLIFVFKCQFVNGYHNHNKIIILKAQGVPQ